MSSLNISIDQLLAFHAIVEMGTFRAAAKHLGKSQPSISSSIKSIEENLGTQVFIRKGHSTELSDAGKRFYQQARSILEAYNKTLNLARNLNNDRGPTVICLDRSVRITKIGDILKSLSPSNAPTGVEIVFEAAEGGYNLLRANAADYFITSEKKESSELELKKIKSLKLLPVISLERLERVKDITSIDGIPLICEGPRTDPRNRPYNPSSSYWNVPELSIKEDLIIEGHGWGYLSECSINRHNNELKEGSKKKLIRIPENLAPLVEQDLYLYRKRKAKENSLESKIWLSA